MGEEAGRKRTDLTGREIDPVAPAQGIANLQALPMQHEALHPDEHLDVVAVDGARRNSGAQVGGSPRQLGARGLDAAPGADPFRLDGGEAAVPQRDHAPTEGLAHDHGAGALGTGLGRGLDRGADFGVGHEQRPLQGLQALDLLPEACQNCPV